jgi:hypothetical protein
MTLLRQTYPTTLLSVITQLLNVEAQPLLRNNVMFSWQRSGAV